MHQRSFQIFDNTTPPVVNCYAHTSPSKGMEMTDTISTNFSSPKINFQFNSHNQSKISNVYAMGDERRHSNRKPTIEIMADKRGGSRSKSIFGGNRDNSKLSDNTIKHKPLIEPNIFYEKLQPKPLLTRQNVHSALNHIKERFLEIYSFTCNCNVLRFNTQC